MREFVVVQASARRRPAIFCLLICLLTAAVSWHVYADSDDAADRMMTTNRDRRPIEELFKTDTVFPQMKGETEIGVAPLYQNNKTGETFSLPFSVEYGLTDNWQVEGEWSSYMWHNPKHGSSTHGIGDLELSTQYSFLNIGDSLFHVAPRFGLQLPLGDVNKGLTEGFMEYEPGVILARDFPELHHTELFTEVGVNFVHRVKTPSDADDAEPAAHEFNLGAGFFTLFEHGAGTLEFNWTNNQWNHHGTENLMYVTPGVLWRVAPEMEFGFGVPVGLNKQSDRYQLAAHFVIEF
jgi:hypothetical protein